MLPLSIIDTSPPFTSQFGGSSYSLSSGSRRSYSVSSFFDSGIFADKELEADGTMFGHPGISVLEYSGGRESAVRKTLSLRGRSLELRSSVATSEQVHQEQGVDAAQDVVADLNPLQKRRGTFLNHTPRVFEMPVSPQKADAVSPSDDAGCERSSPAPGHDEDIVAVTRRRLIEAASLATAEPVEKGLIYQGEHDTRNSTESQGGLRVTKRTSTSSARSSREPKTPPRIQNIGKRRRRQTPFKITLPKTAIVGRHSPLEPLSAHHRRKASESSVSDVPPMVNVDDIGEASAFHAIQEYFQSQDADPQVERTAEQSQLHGQNLHDCISTEPNSRREAPEPTVQLSAAEQLVVEKESISNLPFHSPRRGHSPSGSRSRSASLPKSSMQGSASTPSEQTLVVHKRRSSASTPRGQAARAGSSTLGRMAPPILGHAALCATADLNDLSFYLKNTGPTPAPEPQARRRQRIQKRHALKLFKANGDRKGSLAARVGSVESSDRRKDDREGGKRIVTPACAKETTTSSGTKHFKIVIPSEDDLGSGTTGKNGPRPETEQEDEKGRPAESTDPFPEHQCITWTDEMLNPLASPTMEYAISALNEPEMETKVRTTKAQNSPRSLKSSGPIVRKPVPVNEGAHPLADAILEDKKNDLGSESEHGHPLAETASLRREQTRARKLRDLERVKSRGSGATKHEVTRSFDKSVRSFDTGTEDDCSSRESDNRKAKDALVGYGKRQDVGRLESALLQQKIMLLQRQNAQLAEALAQVVGYESSDGDFDPSEVLSAYRIISCRSGDVMVGAQEEQRRGRVRAA